MEATSKMHNRTLPKMNSDACLMSCLRKPSSLTEADRFVEDEGTMSQTETEAGMIHSSTMAVRASCRS